MKSRDFCYWLQGLLEINEAGGKITELNPAQVRCTKKHLALVFRHEIDPSFGGPEEQATLDEIHEDPITPFKPTKWDRPDDGLIRC